jgi:Flp pilus assembly protein TadG
MSPATSQRRWKRRTLKSAARRGAVAVEFAAVAPLLLAVIVGLVELSRVYSVQNCLETAAREGARFAALDRSGMMLGGKTANQKLIDDVKNYLASNNINPEKVAVKVTSADNPDHDFNLDDPANDLELFQVSVEVPYSDISYTPVSDANDYSLNSALTFRNGRAVVTD